MTPGDIRKRVAEIAAEVRDPGAAASREYELWRDALQWFADQGHSIAIAALETTRLDFPRDWS